MTISQEFIPLSDVNKNLIFQKDGSIGLILSVSAVNFALLFETEQISIIDSFAGLLNSLSFPIQIVIYSKIMDVSSYLHTVDNAIARQTNPALRTMTMHYRDFVEKSIKDNNVLDKKFYICIKLTPLEMGLLPTNTEEKIRKVTTLLEPRRDHLIRQLERLGLKAKQLASEEIVKLFYEIYNQPSAAGVQLPVQSNIKATPLLEIPKKGAPLQPARVENNLPPKLRPIKPTLTTQPQTQIQTQAPVFQQPAPPTQPLAVAQPAVNLNQAPAQSTPTPMAQPSPVRASPFVVEELPDDGP